MFLHLRAVRGTGAAAALAFASVFLKTSRAADVVPAGWELAWSDEFDQPNGSAPDAAKWVLDLGGGGWGNNELQTYTSRRVNSRIENGRLVIEARRERFTGTDGLARDFTSARLKTLGKHAVTYGRIEACIQVPKGQGLWPAFWTLGVNLPSVGWPTCGEIDILENIGREPDLAHGTLHGPGYSGDRAIGETWKLGKGTGKSLADDFHVFAIEWEATRLRWFVDGQHYFTLTPANLPPGAKWVFDKPQFLLLNLAVGGNWPGSPDATTQFPQQMKVDYVRVYRRAASEPK